MIWGRLHRKSCNLDGTFPAVSTIMNTSRRLNIQQNLTLGNHMDLGRDCWHDLRNFRCYQMHLLVPHLAGVARL